MVSMGAVGGWSGSERAPTPWLVRRGVCFQSVSTGWKPGKARPSQGKPASSGSSGGTVSRERLSNTRAVQQARVSSTGSGSSFGLFRGQMDHLDRLDGMPAAGEAGHQFRPQPAAQLLRRVKVSIKDVWRFAPPRAPLSFEEAEQVEIRCKYEGYFARQERDVERFHSSESRTIPPELDFFTVPGIPYEAKQRFSEVRPVNFGQAGRIPGIRSCDTASLLVYVENH